MKKLALLIAWGLSGCASYQQALNGFESASLVSIKSADDNVINLWSTAACATPLSAIIRNPQIIPALDMLCIPNGSVSKLLNSNVPVKPMEPDAILKALGLPGK